MSGNTQKLSIRLLHENVSPKDALRDGVQLVAWANLDSAQIALGSTGGNVPRWARFLDLTVDEQQELQNSSAFGLLFLPVSGRWFALSFGMGHVKLDPDKIEQDFGLRVVLNAVDPKQLKSADVRTPDDNTLSRRSQTSRGSDQTAFAIDVERDIVRGIAGAPKDSVFASRLSGTDALSMDRRMILADLPRVLEEAYQYYQKTDYKANFGWIDQIRHIRDGALIERLDAVLVDALDRAVKGDLAHSLHLAFPAIYDPERTSQLRYKGFRSSDLYPDLDIEGYLDALKKREIGEYTIADLGSHSVHEVDDHGRDCGGKWKIRECIVFEATLEKYTYVLSGGRWYQVDVNLVREVQEFFQRATHVDLPAAEADETEELYNARVAKLDADLICLDRQLIKPVGASSPIEACDFLGRKGWLVHVKDKTSSSRLSHLFSQGTVSARVLVVDPVSRDALIDAVKAVQAETGQTGYETIVPTSKNVFLRSNFTVVYAVITASAEPQLPFFSLVSFRQAARELHALGYNYAFAWLKKPTTGPKGKAKRVKKAEVPVVAE